MSRGIGLLAIGLAALLAGCGADPSTTSARPTASASAVPSASSAATGGPAGTTRTDSVPVPTALAAQIPAGKRPVRLVIPQIGVDSALVDLGIASDGSLQVPTDFQRAGWLKVGPGPGQRGPAVIAGHVDSKTGPAVFYRLRELTVGDEVRVVLADHSTVRFTVDTVQQYPKAKFPTAAVYGPTPTPVLRLITCGGTFDRAVGHYRDNLVVYAS